jgi:hypothetical protein
MSDRAGDNIPPYVDPSSVPIARELGILFGFLLASLVIMAVYTVLWRGMLMPFFLFHVTHGIYIPHFTPLHQLLQTTIDTMY